MGELVKEIKGRSSITVLFIILFLSQLIVAQQTGGITLTLREASGNWMMIGIIAVAAAYGVVALIYMFSKAIGSPQYQAWSQNEFYQVTATLVILIFVFAAVKFEDGMMESFGYTPTPEQPNSAISAGVDYLGKVRTFAVLRFVAGFTLNTYLSITSESLKVAMKFEPYFDPGDAIGDWIGALKKSVAGVILSSLGTAIGITTAQRWVLEIIGLIAFTILLPLGIVLRAVPFFRNVGSVFISIAVGLYLVYPLTFLLDTKIVEHVRCPETMPECNWYGTPSLEEGIAEIAILVPALGVKTPGMLFGHMRNIRLLGAGTTLYSMTFIMMLASSLFEGAAFAIIVLGLFLPALNVVLTFGVIRHIAGIMGTDVSLSDLMKMI